MSLGNVIASMYVTLMPVILAGVANMRLLKSGFLRGWEKPLDAGLLLKDGQPLFGKNKTWRGAIGMILCSMAAMLAWGYVCGRLPFLAASNQFYTYNANTLAFNLRTGFWLGLMYILFELPNSFWKRRRGVAPGQAAAEPQSWRYMWLDQMDSLFGCAWVVSWHFPLSWTAYLGYVFLGAATHLTINYVLVAFRWKKTV